ncbi:MAG: aldo/keto reductase [bacterium]
MEKIRLGRTGLMVSRSGFGALPIQRITLEESTKLLRRAFDNGINFFDTARAYSDSEAKLGAALADVRRDIIIATKTFAQDRETLFQHLETSLAELKTDTIDILQLHTPARLPDAEDPAGVYQALLEARQKGMIRFIGLSNHRLDVALAAAASGRYDTIQFPLNSLSAAKDLNLITECRKKDLGVIAMKGLSGGLITRPASSFAFLRQFDNLVPIWGIQREWELDEFIALEKNPPVLDETMWQTIQQDRAELGGSFCRACGYCMPCPVGIPIRNAARMSLLLARAPYQKFLTDEYKAQMALIEDCQECGECREKCPYELDTPSLLKENLKIYREFCEKMG